MPKVARQKSAVKDSVAQAVRELLPRSPDTKYTGFEPNWEVQPTPENRLGLMSRAFAWYGYYYSNKDAKEMVQAWLEQKELTDIARRLKSVPDNQVPTTLGWLCRMNLRGLVLDEKENRYVVDKVNAIAPVVQPQAEKKADDSVSNRVTIQDRLREKMRECAGELDGLYDEFVRSGTKLNADIKPVSTIRGMNIAPQFISEISSVWQDQKLELEQVLAGKDAQLVEGYSHLGRIQIKNMIKFCDLVIEDCAAYVQIKKVERKPRKKKAVSPEKQARRFRSLRSSTELKLQGQPATVLVNASEAWLFDVKKRKLIHVVADSHAGSFTIKGNTVIGISPGETVQKTVRKPEATIPALMSAGKPQSRRVFKDIRATEVKWNGRGNDNLLILKAW